MAQQFTIQNDHIKVSVKQKGAEFSSLQSLKNGQEYLWQADPQYWGRHSCILFPIIGALAKNEYQYGGNSYSLKRHGFARNMPFALAAQSTDSMTFVLNSNEATKEAYPFDFQLQAQYVVKGAELSIHYRVHNRDQQTIYFSLGAHPAFNCPLKADEKRSDYSLVFNHPEQAYTQKLSDQGLRNGQTALVLDQTDTLPIADDLFDNDALILSNLSSNKVSLVNGEQQKIWTFDFSGFSYLGIWSPNAEAPFVCIEPWHGVADPIHPSGLINEKEGIVALATEQTFECIHRVEIH